MAKDVIFGVFEGSLKDSCGILVKWLTIFGYCRRFSPIVGRSMPHLWRRWHSERQLQYFSKDLKVTSLQLDYSFMQTFLSFLFFFFYLFIYFFYFFFFEIFFSFLKKKNWTCKKKSFVNCGKVDWIFDSRSSHRKWQLSLFIAFHLQRERERKSWIFHSAVPFHFVVSSFWFRTKKWNVFNVELHWFWADLVGHGQWGSANLWIKKANMRLPNPTLVEWGPFILIGVRQLAFKRFLKKKKRKFAEPRFCGGSPGLPNPMLLHLHIMGDSLMSIESCN